MFKSNLKSMRSLIFPLTRAQTSKASDVLFDTYNNAGTITLNRPKQLNSLTVPILSRILMKLNEWEKSKLLIITKGAGGKAFCAGGDVKTVRVSKHNELAWHEYNLVYLISIYKIPYITLNDGFTLGAGLGISMPGKYRIATEQTAMAMPENKIGVCPDVGGTYFLPRLKSKIGFFLGLTGETLQGNDTVKARLATHFVPRDRLYDLERCLSMCTDETGLNAVLSKFSQNSDHFSLAPYLKDIEYCFSAPTIEEIMMRLEITNNEWSIKTLEALHGVCPGSLKVTFRALHAGAAMDLRECLMMEFLLTYHATESHDFSEGVRARLMDKDNNPQWKPRTLSEVTDQYVDSFFQQLPSRKELTFAN